MALASTEELVLAEMAGAGDGGTGHPHPRQLSDLTEVLSLSPHRMSDRIELASTLEALREQGLIAEDAPDEAGTVDERITFRLTDDGRQRAAEVRDRLAATTVEIVDGTREECSLAEVEARLETSVAEVAAGATDDGVYYTREVPDEVFVGRDAALDECEAALERIREGTGQAVMLAGPPGVGKTTLAEQVLERATSDGFSDLRARCQGEATTPYQPLRDALAGIDADPFAEVGPAVEDPDAFQAQQMALFNDVTDVLTADASFSHPRLLYLDDLHLADTETFAYLKFLLERLADLPLVLVGSYRQAELPDAAPVVAETTPAEAPSVRVELGPFDRERTRRLLESVLETRELPGGFVDAVHQRTGGNPLFVEITVETLLGSDLLDPELGVYPESPSEMDMPAEVRETIDDYVLQFPASARELLQWAALLGERFDSETLVAVTDLPGGQFRTYLELFVDGAVFDRTGDRLTFRSEVVREALLEKLDADERQRRHEQVAVVLEDREDSDPAAVAHHHELAGNDELAIAAYRQAAEEATAVYAPETSLDHLKDALAMAREADDTATLVELAIEIAGVNEPVGRYDEAERFAQFARQQASTDDERRRALTRLASVATARGDHERALEFAERGLDLGGDREDAVACRLLGQRCSAQRGLGRYDAAVETAKRRRELAAHLDDDAQLATTLKDLGRIATRRGNYERSREYHERSLEIQREIEDRHGVAKCLNNLGVIAYEQGDYEEAREYYEESRDFEREIGDRHGVAKCLINLGLIAEEQGDSEEAREYLRRSLDITRELGARHETAISLHNLGHFAYECGDYERAIAHLEESLDTYREVGDRHYAAMALGQLGKVTLALDDLDVAADYFERAGEEATEVDDNALAAACLAHRAALAFETGDDDGPALGDRALDHLEAGEGNTGGPDPVEAVQALVEAAADAGHLDRARDWCRRASAAVETLPTADDRHRWFEQRLEELPDGEE